MFFCYFAPPLLLAHLSEFNVTANAARCDCCIIEQNMQDETDASNTDKFSQQHQILKATSTTSVFEVMSGKNDSL